MRELREIFEPQKRIICAFIFDIKSLERRGVCTQQLGKYIDVILLFVCIDGHNLEICKQANLPKAIGGIYRNSLFRIEQYLFT